MDHDRLIRCLDDPDWAADHLRRLGLRQTEHARKNLVSIAGYGVTLDLLRTLFEQLNSILPELSDPDLALNNLDRFFGAARNRLGLATLFERDVEALAPLLQLFSTSQHLSDSLIQDPESYDLLRLTAGQPVSRGILMKEIGSEVALAEEEREVISLLRRHKRREMQRIAYGDIVKRQRVSTVTEQLSYLAEASCEAALQAAWRKLEARHGRPHRPDGSPARLTVLALGKLGGWELNYSSDIDLIFLCDEPEGRTDGKRAVSLAEFFERLVRQAVKYLSEPSAEGAGYRVDLRLRPHGSQGPAVLGVKAAWHYYDTAGRTWERQAFVKARAIAGDLAFGQQFLARLEPWIYRRYLTSADIVGIRALKRRIEQRCLREGGDQRNVKTGRGGIRDIEFVIQFLQLLNGSELPDIRTGNTLEAIGRLAECGCLTSDERTMLEENYEMLRRLEHRLQIMFDLQTHTMPEGAVELKKLALRMGYRDGPHRSPLDAFQADYRRKTEQNRNLLNHLLSDAFSSDDRAEPEIDLVLDPAPEAARIAEVLGRYGFRQVGEAYHHLMDLARERIPFLSTRRCRHFLAAIAPQLLEAIGRTPDPDGTLIDLSKISDSLGGKGLLWELFSVNPPSLQLYVRLCAATPYLSGILTSNPGMIDELLDSLLLDRLPRFETLARMLEDLLHGAEDPEPILHGFKNSLHLRVGVRDILGREDIRETHRALSDISELCLQQIARREHRRLIARFGTPILEDGPRAGGECELILLAMGKLGGREPNYHSDLDVMFLYEAEGHTRHRNRGRQDTTTTNRHFFSQLAQRIIKEVNRMGPYGRLYELDARLRPTGRSGLLALPLAEFSRYFITGTGQLWERQALCKARPIYGSGTAREATREAVRAAILGRTWQPAFAHQIRDMRLRLQQTASSTNLKRGPGGTVDIEFAVQMLQLRHAAEYPRVLAPGTLDALDQLRELGLMERESAAAWARSYRLLRRVEASLRLMNTTARHDLPRDEGELAKLAYLLNYNSAAELLDACRGCTQANRERFDRLFDQAAKSQARPPVGWAFLPDAPPKGRQ